MPRLGRSQIGTGEPSGTRRWRDKGNIIPKALLPLGQPSVLELAPPDDKGSIYFASSWAVRGYPVRSAKFLSIRRPSDWLFSGWNCVAKTLSRQIIEQNGPP